MRLFLGVVLALAAVIGAWLFTMETPSGELATAEKEVLAKAVADDKQDVNVQIKEQVQAEAANKTDAQRLTEPSALEQALLRYPNVAVEDIQTIFAEDPELIGIRPDFMLALMERGDIAPNQVVVSAPRMGPLTGSMFVIANARNSFTVEHFDKLLSLGADINGSETWRTVMAMENNSTVLDKWYQHASLGPEVHEELYNKALAFGNLAMHDYLLDDKGGATVDLEIEPMNKAMASGMVRGTVENLDELEAQLAESTEVNSEVARAEVAHFLTMRHGQAIMLQEFTDDEQELEELKESTQKIADKLLQLSQGSN
ncbi:hypothetical protein CWE21_12740 [Pseudidiomarina aquimaris]|uniref:Uncharacterized protein n=1 Tax=Pseudidiomarina aquimaris TaxID=641841 RepID=A0A432XB76_9GAMM|nr:hypothetical protein [Pseudidiomarina aquimaris]RUO46001.1 hypothetical protein CWE21_12740 [Pseudidiomarina aquimaris]